MIILSQDLKSYLELSYVIFKNKIAVAKMNVIVLAIITGMAWISKPYMHQSNTPKIKRENITIETSSADLERQVFINWGINAIVVSSPAIKPILSGVFRGWNCIRNEYWNIAA